MHPARLLLIALTLGLCSCAHVAKKHVAPDASAVVEQSGELRRQIAATRVVVKKVAADVQEVKTQHEAEQAAVPKIRTELEELARVAPPELMPQIHGIMDEVDDLKALQIKGGTRITGLTASVADVSLKVDAADTKAELILARVNPDYLAKVEAQTSELNTLDQKYAVADRKLLWYQLHWWGSWIVAGLGVAVMLLLAFLKATGRLAIGAARAAV